MTAAIYAESSGALLESVAIGNVIHNRSNHTGRSIIDIVQHTGIYGYNTNSYNAAYGNFSNRNQRIKNARVGTINALQGGRDFSNGAYFWEGDVFLQNSNNFFTSRLNQTPPVFIQTAHYGTSTFFKYNNNHPTYRTNVYP
jgi:hypothetical protein